MPIISASPIEKRIFRITMTYGQGIIENMVISDTGEYQIYYMKNCKSHNETGKIVNIVYNPNYTKNSYILFDYECDVCSHKHARDKIFFHEIIFIKDVTPTDAYMIAVQRGFQGSVDEWLESMRGDVGKSAYEICVEQGFEGSVQDWIKSLRGPRGLPGKDAYELAVEYGGYKGSREEFASMYKTIQESVIYVNSFNDRVKSLEKYNEGVDKLVTDMVEEVSSLKVQINQVSKKADSALTKIGQFRETVEADQELQNKKIEAIDRATKNNAEAIISSEKAMSRKIESVNEDLIASNKTIRNEINEVVNATNKKIAVVNEEITDKVNTLTKADEEIKKTISSSTEELKKTITTIQENVDRKLEEESIKNDKAFNEVNAAINDTNSDINDLAKGIQETTNAIEKQIGTIEKNISDIQEVYDEELAMKINQAISDIDTLEDAVSVIKDSVTWNTTM